MASKKELKKKRVELKKEYLRGLEEASNSLTKNSSIVVLDVVRERLIRSVKSSDDMNELLREVIEVIQLLDFYLEKDSKIRMEDYLDEEEYDDDDDDDEYISLLDLVRD